MTTAEQSNDSIILESLLQTTTETTYLLEQDMSNQEQQQSALPSNNNNNFKTPAETTITMIWASSSSPPSFHASLASTTTAASSYLDSQDNDDDQQVGVPDEYNSSITALPLKVIRSCSASESEGSISLNSLFDTDDDYHNQTTGNGPNKKTVVGEYDVDHEECKEENKAADDNCLEGCQVRNEVVTSSQKNAAAWLSEEKKDDEKDANLHNNKSSRYFNSSSSSALTLFSKGTFSEKYRLGKQIGEGAYAVVKQAIEKQSGQAYAVKILLDDEYGRRQDSFVPSNTTILNEIRILVELQDHPNILNLRDVYYDVVRKQYYLVTDLLSGGDFLDRIVEREYYQENDARDALVKILGALQYCHDRRIAHRDLKPENLLLRSKASDTDVVLADFGFAKKVMEPNSLLTKCGTPGYIAPEILNVTYDNFAEQWVGGYDVSADMWSLGVIAFILLGGYSPFEDTDQRVMNVKICEADYTFHPKFWGHVSQDAKDFVSSLLTLDPAKRCTATQALHQSKWLKSSTRTLSSQNLSQTLEPLRKFNAKRKWKALFNSILATRKLYSLVVSHHRH